GRQGPPGAAVPAAAAGTAGLLAAVPAGPRAVPGAAAPDARVGRAGAARLPPGRAGSGLDQTGQYAHATAQLRHAPTGGGRGPGDAAEAARAPVAADDGALHARGRAAPAPTARRAGPAGGAGATGAAGTAPGRSPTWTARTAWRWLTSCGRTGPRSGTATGPR